MKKILVILAIIMMILVGGCKSDKDTGGGSKAFVGGDTAIEMEFIDGAPPDEVYDNGQYPFSVAIKIENVGEEDIDVNQGYIKITGINPTDFGKSSVDMTQDFPDDLDGVKKNVDGSTLSGGVGIAEFNDLNYEPDVAGDFEGPRIRAEACFDYKTRASSNICVKEDLLTNEGSESICELSEDKDVENSGGPIQVTSVTEQPMGSDKIHVSFVVDHVGDVNDRFFKVSTECDDKPTNSDRYKVFVDVTSDINGVTAECSGLQDASSDKSSGYITLFDKEPRTVICSFDVSGASGEFEDLFTVELSYRYMQFIEKNILVKDVKT